MLLILILTLCHFLGRACLLTDTAYTSGNLKMTKDGDISGKTFPTYQECQNFCKQYTECVGFTFRPNNDGACTLKKFLGTTFYREHAISAPVDCDGEKGILIDIIKAVIDFSIDRVVKISRQSGLT